jgi:hypothetical protein
MLTSVRALGLGADGAGGGGGAGGAGGATGVGAGATTVAGASILTGSGRGSGRTSGLAGSGLGCSGRGGSGRGCGLTGSGLGGSGFGGFGFGGSGGVGSGLGGGTGVSNCTMTGGGSTSVWGFSSAPDSTKAISAPCSAIATASADGLMLGTARLRLSADRARPACRTGQWLCAAGNERRVSCHARK